MRAIAPGKLLLTGAYAVLEGAPAVVLAVDRHAVADTAQEGESVLPEVRAAFGDERAPRVDTSALQGAGGRKLGLGSSAAALVAALGARALACGEDLRSPAVRARLFRAARESHARVQSGGSGVDVAASIHGGLLRYALDAGGDARILELDLPADLVIATYDSGSSASTRDMRARFEATRALLEAGRVLGALCTTAEQACAAIEAGDTAAFIRRARDCGSALAALGELADSPIVPSRFAELASLAAGEHAAFLPSGAGGGDVAIWLGVAPPSRAFALRAEALSMRPIGLGVDRGGVRAQST